MELENRQTIHPLMNRNALYLAALATCSVFILARRKRTKHPPLPPSPPAHPLWGHVQLIPAEKQEITFYELGQTYGDIMYLKFPGSDVIVLNGAEVANDLLEKRSANYSDRPKLLIFEMMGWIRTLTFTGYGKIFQTHRRLFQDHFNARKVVDYQHIQAVEANVLVKNLLQNPDKREHYLTRFSTSIILNIAYGYGIETDEDDYMNITSNVNHVLSNCGPAGSTPVDFFPFLQYMPRWFPGTYYANFARDNRSYFDDMHDIPLERVKRDLAAGIAKPSFVSHHLENYAREGDNYRFPLVDIRSAAGVMYCAGAETTSTSLSYLFYSMLLHPEVQERAQEEIDRVVGSSRLPEFADRPSLPYVEAVFQELLRCYPVVPLGVPHRSTNDDVYKGMFIPKGSLIITNIRGMTWDHRVYAEPKKFNPARFLPKPEGNAEPFPIVPFGFGRRICPGRHLADGSVWIAITTILATMNISKARDAKGQEITPKAEFTSGITSHPAPFPCMIKPRSEEARNLILQASI